MDNIKKENEAITLHLFKLKGDVSTYILGRLDLTYVDAVKIKNPVFVEAVDFDAAAISGLNSDIASENPIMRFYPCNLSYTTKIEYSILLSTANLLFQLQQDFIPAYMIKEYFSIWRDR